ncbi:MAG: VTT domain-containing protein [Roseiarcus sp.]
MRSSLRILVVLILASSVAWLASSQASSGAWTAVASRSEGALALAQRFEGAGWLSLAGLQVVAATAGILPASLVGMAAGALFGVANGFATSSAGLLLGALVAFGLSRSTLRAFVERVIVDKTRVRNLDAAVARDGWRLVCLLRASPLMPFVATSYLLGLSAVSLRDYMLGTLAALPALLGYVSLGAFAQAGLSASTGAALPLQRVLLATGFAATALAVVHIGTLVAKVAGGGSTPPA